MLDLFKTIINASSFLCAHPQTPIKETFEGLFCKMALLLIKPGKINPSVINTSWSRSYDRWLCNR